MPSSKPGDLARPGRARARDGSGASSMPRSANASQDRLRRVGRRRDRHRQRHDEGDLRSIAQAPFGEVVVHQQRRLARRRRALERRRRDADDDPPAAEVGEHVASGERARHRVELVAAPRPARASPTGRGRRRAPPPARRRRTRRRRSRPACVRVDRADGGLHEPHAGLDDVRVAMDARRRAAAAPNITSSFENPKTKPSALVDQRHLDVVAELLRQASTTAPARRTRRPAPPPASRPPTTSLDERPPAIRPPIKRQPK